MDQAEGLADGPWALARGVIVPKLVLPQSLWVAHGGTGNLEKGPDTLKAEMAVTSSSAE